MIEQVAIYSAGGFGREVAWLIEACNKDELKYEIIGFIDDDPKLQGSIVNDIPVLSFQKAQKDYPGIVVVGAIGNPATRQIVVGKSEEAGFKFDVIVHPKVERSDWVRIDEGTLICAGSILTTNITLGKHVQINLDCTIGHDVVMGDFTTLAPGVHVSGWVHFGERVYVGTGAVILNGTREDPIIIEDDVVIGAGACVTKSVQSGLTVVGVPAKPLKRA